MEALYQAVEQKDASTIATYFQHKRIPSPALHAPLLESSDVAKEYVTTRLGGGGNNDNNNNDDDDNNKMVVDLRDLQVLLQSPTAFEAPWAALHVMVQYLMTERHNNNNNNSSSLDNDTRTAAVVVSMQAFLQQVAAEWNATTAATGNNQTLLSNGNNNNNSYNKQQRLSIASRSDTTETNESPRVWLERIVQEILRPQFQESSSLSSSSSHNNPNNNNDHDKKNYQLFPIISTIASLAECLDAEFHYIILQLVLLSGPSCRGETLVAWLQCIHQCGGGGRRGRCHSPRTVCLDRPQWITLVQILQGAVVELDAVDATTCRATLSGLWSLYRQASVSVVPPVTTTTTTTRTNQTQPPNEKDAVVGLPKAMRQDPVWHALVFSLYQIAYSARDSAGGFAQVHDMLEACLVTLSTTDLLLKWLRWTLHNTQTIHPNLQLCMAVAIYKAGHAQNQVRPGLGDPTSSTTTTTTRVPLGPIFWAEVSNFVFANNNSKQLGGGRVVGTAALTFVRDLLWENECTYRGRGHFDFGADEDRGWLSDASQFLYQSLKLVGSDASTEGLLIDTVFDTMGNYFESVCGFDMLLSVIMLTILYESNKRYILSRMRRFFMCRDEEEGLQQVCCLVLRFVVSIDSNDSQIWQCFSPIFHRELSRNVFSDLVKAVITNEPAQINMIKLSDEWTTQVLPSSCVFSCGQDGNESMGRIERGFHMLCQLCLRGTLQIRREALGRMGSFLNGSRRRILGLFHKTFLYEVCCILDEESMEAMALEKLFQVVSVSLFCDIERRKKQIEASESENQSSPWWGELIWKARLLARILSKAKDRSDSEVLNETMWPYDTLLDSLFDAVVEWHERGPCGGLEACQRSLDVRNNDFHVAAAITSLSLTYQESLDSIKILKTIGAPNAESIETTLTEESVPGSSQQPLSHSMISLARCDKDAMLFELRQDVAELCLVEGIWKAKSSVRYKPFVLALSSFLTFAETGGENQISSQIKVEDLLDVVDRSLLSVVFSEFISQGMTAKEIDGILALVKFVCKRVASINVVPPKGVLERLLVLYDIFCSETRIAGMLLYLESNPAAECEVTTHSWRVLDPTGRTQLEASVRRFREDVLQTLAGFLDFLVASPASGFIGEEIEVVRVLLRSLCKDLKLGLQCGSGGIDANLCNAFVNCVENTCWSFTSSLDKLDVEELYRVRGFCREAVECVDSISNSVDLSNVDVLGTVLSLTTGTLPSVVNLVFKEGCIKNGKVKPNGCQESICLLAHGVFGICLHFNRKRLNPLEEMQTPNAYNLVREKDRWGDFGKEKKAPTKKDVYSESTTKGLGGFFLSKLSGIMDSDRIWDCAFTAVLKSYRDVLYYSEKQIHQSHVKFQSNNGRCTFMKWQIAELRTVFQNVMSVFDQEWEGEQAEISTLFSAATLPSSVKDWLCAFLEQFCLTLEAAIVHLQDMLSSNNCSSANDSSFVACLSFLLAWLSLDGDLCLHSKTWLDWEERIASRADSKQSVVVVADASFYKDLAKVAEQSKDIARHLASLCGFLNEAPVKSCFNDRSTLWGDTKDLVHQVYEEEESFDFQGKLVCRFDLLQRTTPPRQKDQAEKGPAKRKKRKTPSESAAASVVFRNRNQIVEDWLQKDKVIDDTFADLEDFLVED